MNAVYQSAFLKALGWSLIDSLWQMGALWFLYILITGNGKKFSSSFRYSLALIILFIGATGFVADIFWNYTDPGREFSIFGNPSFITDYMPFLSGSYLVISSFYIARWIHQYTNNRNVLNEAQPAGIEALHLIQQLKYITSVIRDIKILCSSSVFTPLTIGFLKPVILLPVAAFTQLNTRQIEALIVHEFFHIKRNDYLVNLLTSFVEAFLFFNPFGKLLLSNIKHERENCCDDEVIRLGYDRWEYAHALYTLSANSQHDLKFALAATGNAKHLLLARIKRLLRTGTPAHSIKKPLAIFFVCLFAAGSLTKPVNADKPAEAVALVAVPGIQVVNVAKERPVVIFTKKKIKIKEPPAAAPAPPLPSAPLSVTVTVNESDDENHAFYVSNMEIIDFSMIEAQISKTQRPAGCEPYQPFVPSSTFYFPGHEISVKVDGKTTIHL